MTDKKKLTASGYGLSPKLRVCPQLLEAVTQPLSLVLPLSSSVATIMRAPTLASSTLTIHTCSMSIAHVGSNPRSQVLPHLHVTVILLSSLVLE